MKRYLIVAAIIAGLLFLFLRRSPHTEQAPDRTGTPAESLAASDSESSSGPVHNLGVAEQAAVVTPRTEGDEKQRLLGPEGIRGYNEAQNGPVEFNGLVLDQDSNALREVRVELDVSELNLGAFLTNVSGKTTHILRQTGVDGRFEVSGLKGHFVTVTSLSKEGYEPEITRRDYGTYGAQGATFDNPAVFSMWGTNLHQPLVSGNKRFEVIPDGRHYAIDLVKGTMAEGDAGDLVAWIRRPESASWGQKYDWSCELTLPAGGMVESQSSVMFRAPDAGYTNSFSYQEEATVNGWGGATGAKRFYVSLRNGQIYGRITICLYSAFNYNKPGMIEVQYSINPSGSPLLR